MDANNKNGNDKSKAKDGDRKIGEGMTSLDSTQAPLKAETGLPDYDAMDKDKARKLEKDDSDQN
jgi:hypothetical protein